MGYQGTQAQLMSVPPYAAAAIATVLVGYLGDLTRQRGIYAITFALLGVIGFAILLSNAPIAAKYTGTFLAGMGIYPLIPNTVCWLTANTEGVYKRGISLGIAMGWANLQGVGLWTFHPRMLSSAQH
jgi:MFS family permease